MKPYFATDRLKIYHGDCRDVLATLPDESVQAVVTSPPYYGLRDYQTARWIGGDEGCDHVDEEAKAERLRQKKSMIKCGERTDGSTRTRVHDETIGKQFQYRGTCDKCGATRTDNQLGLEQTPDDYITNMVEVFREVRRVLREDGTLWLNMGDSYNSPPAGNKIPSGFSQTRPSRKKHGVGSETVDLPQKQTGLKPKDLIGIPWRLALALQADGWWLRQDIIWHKKNPMPESCTDRCTKAHEYIFLMTKAARYHYDADAIREEPVTPGLKQGGDGRSWHDHGEQAHGGNRLITGDTGRDPAYTGKFCGVGGRNKRSVWTVNTKPFKDAHFATFPPKLIEPCILAGTSAEGACPDCGSPWERVVERHDRGHDGSRYGERVVAANVSSGGSEKSTLGSSGGELVGYNKTTGWKPTCKCKAGKPVPCTVLDPFHGSGTTGEVALNHSCNYIGIELNEDYIKLSLQRFRQGRLNL